LRLTLGTRARLGVDGRVGVLLASTKVAATSTEDITNDLSTLRVAGDDQGSVGAGLVVGGHGADAHAGAVVEGIAAGSGGVVVLDVLDAAGVELCADGIGQGALTAGVRLVVAAEDEDAQAGAVVALLEGHGGGGREGAVEGDGEEGDELHD